MVRNADAGRSRIAAHRADRSRDRQRGQDGQHDEADSVSPDHDASIQRPLPTGDLIDRAGQVHNEILRKRSAFAITETELKLMATLAIIGLNRIPKNGYSTPAAIGTPIVL